MTLPRITPHKVLIPYGDPPMTGYVTSVAILPACRFPQY